MTGQYISHKIGITRKPHQCRVCGDIIDAGESAIIYRGVEDSEGFYTSHFHNDCWDYSRDWDECDWAGLTPGAISRAEVQGEM